MSVIEGSDIKVYYSGGASNDNPAQSLGGVKSATEVVDDNLHNLFARVSAAEALAGSTKYRGIYISNENGDALTWENIKAYMRSQSTSGDTSIEIGVATQAADAEMSTIANEDTAPAPAVTFVSTTDPAAGRDVGNLADGSFRGIWVKRIVSPNAAAFSNDTAELGWRGESTSV